MKKLVFFVCFASVLIIGVVLGVLYSNERETILTLQKSQQKLHLQEEEKGEFPESCQKEIEQEFIGKAVSVNCAPKAYCLCTKLQTPFFEANSSSELCDESKLNPKQRYFCVSNKPGGQQ